jgi:hypothetical protein
MKRFLMDHDSLGPAVRPGLCPAGRGDADTFALGHVAAWHGALYTTPMVYIYLDRLQTWLFGKRKPTIDGDAKLTPTE